MSCPHESTCEARVISARLPTSPKPVTSLQPVAPASLRHATAAALLCCMCRSASAEIREALQMVTTDLS